MRYFDSSGIIGIPNREIKSQIPTINSPQIYEFVIQEHKADRAGLHYDLRLGPSNGMGYSWAGRRLPEPGGKELFVRQPDHTIDYFDFAGEIRDGYGKGTVSTHTRARAEILKSEPTKITFNLYGGSGATKYTLLNLSGDDWLLINHSGPSKEIKNLFPEPLKYKTNYTPKEGDVDTPKIDGASAVMFLRAGKTPMLFSKRTSKRSGELIEYTPKIPNILSQITPKDLGTTILRTEIYGVTPDNKEIPNRTLSGILNAGVLKSRELQKQLQTPLRVAAYDVVKYQGKDVRHLPFSEKELIIKQIRTKFPYIDIPSEVNQKVNFKEGKVVWRNNVPYKVKNISDYDVYVRNIFPSINDERAGGFEYSFSPKGQIAGKVGTGFTHTQLKSMLKNPNKYLGLVAKVVSQEQHPSGALRAPAFKGWHLEKNL